MIKTWIKWSAVILAALFVLIQIVRPARTNPPVVPSRGLDAHVQVPGEVQSVLKRSCYNCHSSETIWPWYSHVAPVSWLVADDVDTARSHVNFQDWEAQVNASEGNEHLGLICKEIRERTMPPFSYRLMHKDAPLSPEEVSAACAWSRTFADPAESDAKTKQGAFVSGTS